MSRCSSTELSRLANAYDTRYHGGTNTASSSTRSVNQNANFGQLDGTGVEAVCDIMPTELRCLVQAVKDAMQFETKTLRILDFGCGDGRYLPAFIRIARHLSSTPAEGRATKMEILCLDVSVGALEELQAKISRWEASADGQKEKEFLKFDFLVTDPKDSAAIVEGKIREFWKRAENIGEVQKPFHLAVCGWGTMSCIPDLEPYDHLEIKKPRQFSFLQMMANLSSSLLNITSTKNNFMREQRKFNAMRQARLEILEKKRFLDTSVVSNQHIDRQLQYIEGKLGLGTHTQDGFYYGKHQMFYTAVDYDEELKRTVAAGFQKVDIRICNIMNFFDILSHPRKRKLNDALIELCEGVEGAQIGDIATKQSERCRQFLLSGFKKAGHIAPNVSSACLNPVFRGSKTERINQVARYFTVYATNFHSFPSIP